MAGNTLQAMQIGLHVVGNNIANANTPGYVRERAIFAPAPVQKLGSLTLGLGVEITGIVQSIDKFAEERLRDAGGDRASAEAQEAAYRDLEVILNPLGDANISAKLTDFFNAIQLINQKPEEPAHRNLAISAGEDLTQTINTTRRRIDTEHENLNTQVSQLADEINTLSEEIRQLNLRIVQIEGGGASGSDAGGIAESTRFGTEPIDRNRRRRSQRKRHRRREYLGPRQVSCLRRHTTKSRQRTS